jgi:hypothetical protein
MIIIKKKGKLSISEIPVQQIRRITLSELNKYIANPGGKILVPPIISQPVPSNKLIKGLSRAKKEIEDMFGAFGNLMIQNYSIKEIGIEISFSAQGKFLGFGVGGATTLKIVIAPVAFENNKN